MKEHKRNNKAQRENKKLEKDGYLCGGFEIQ